jgi:uncharacterized repeat protein (TIGR01451 family)/fimbrial isopeptide formation D2 family protein
VTIDVPSEILIGEDFQFEVKFKNSVAVGYGPYIELYLPAKGPDSNSPDSTSTNQKCDGIKFLSAATSFANPPTVALPPTYDSLLSTASTSLDCPNGYTLPFAGMTAGPAPSGDYQLVVIELPFGSFDPSQPDVVINVRAHLSDFADEGTPLTIYARGGFRYGSDALDNHPTDLLVESNVDQDPTTPRVLKLNKAYLGPEGEAVSGPNFINFYPLKYTVAVDIADQQTVQNLLITDNLPANLQFAGNVQVKIKGNNAVSVTGCSTTNPGPFDVVISSPPTSLSPNGTLSVKLCSPVVGSIAPDDVSISFDFFVPEKDANGKDILQTDCKNSPVAVENDVSASGDWDPLDPRDPTTLALPGATVPIKSDLTNVDNVLQAKCLAIQKNVAPRPPDTGGPGITPLDTLRYELNFQISDYRSMGKINITDVLSDGQLLVGTPTLTFVGDQFGSYNNVSFTSTSFTSASTKNVICGGIKGGTLLTFRVSSALAAAAGTTGPPRHQSGILTGGHAAGPISSTPARGQIVFFAQIQDTFAHQVPANDPKRFVDKADPLKNCVSIDGLVYQNEIKPTVPSTPLGKTQDDSGTQVSIASLKPKKTVYTVRNGTSTVCGPPTSSTPCLNLPGTPQDVHPGDNVTFRIEYPIPSGDAESLSIEDWLPLPVFDVTDPDANPSTIAVFPGFVPMCAVPPPPGIACRLTPTHTLPTAPSLASGTANNLVFTYGTFNNTANSLMTIDLLFTVTVTNKPFADGLHLTNEARENESNTFGPVPSQVTIAQVNLREPSLAIRKGVIAANNPNALFSDPAIPQTAPDPTAQAPVGTIFSLAGINGPITSSYLAGGGLNSDVSNVDANDAVTFAIAIENQGGHPAFDVILEDIIPSCFAKTSKVTVQWGTGAVIPSTSFTLTPSGSGFTFTLNPGVSIPAATTTGSNIIILTFAAKLKSDISPGCCINDAELKKYSNEPKGPDFVAAGFGGTYSNDPDGPFKDSAKACVTPQAAKCVTTTSEAHTTPDNSLTGTPDVAIGEIVRYRLTVTLPEGVSPFFKIVDNLPAGMTYLGLPKIAFVSNLGISSTAAGLSGAGLNINSSVATCPSVGVCAGPTPTFAFPPSLVTGGVFTSGVDPTFGFGTLTNNDNDADLEYVILEFNALVNNQASNVTNTTLSDRYDVFVGQTQQPVATSNQTDVRVVEPNLTMTKTVAPNPAFKGQTLTYTVQYTNNGTADAFDVVLKDTLPAGLTLGTVTASCPVATLPNQITMTCAQVPKAPNPGSTVIVTYQAIANPATCPATLQNGATLTWTSLPGPKGTLVNPTGSSTPGNSGLVDGERDGVTPPLTLNDYATTASAATKIECPCCLQTSNETLTCNSNGTFNYTVTLTNLTGATVSAVTFSPPAGVTITPSTLAIPPLANGASTTVTVTIGGSGAVSGATVCFYIGLAGPAAPACKVQHCVTLPSCQSNCATPPIGMVSWWPLNETSGTTAVDIMDGNNGSTRNNAGVVTPIGTPGAPFSLAGQHVGDSLNFITSYVDVTNAPNLNFGTGEFSIDAWVRVIPGATQSSGATVQAIVDKTAPTPGAPLTAGYALFVHHAISSTGGRLGFVIDDGVTPTAVSSPLFHPASLPSGWHHVAVSVARTSTSSANVTLYVDGVASAPVTVAVGNTSNPASLLIGRSRLLSLLHSNFREVALDEIEIFNRAVPAADIQSIFAAGKKGKCTATIKGVKFNDLNGNGVRDAGEPGLAGWTIKVTDQNGNSHSVITDTQGNYSFTVPAPGNYTVAEGGQSGWTQTAPASGTYSVAVLPGQVVIRDFGNKKDQTSGCATPPKGMVAWWPLDETSGNVVHSIVGNHDGTTLPGPIGTSLSVAPAPKVGSALFFGAARAEVLDDPALDFGKGDFSIDAWVRSSQPSLLSAIVDKLDTSTTTHRGYAFFVQGGMVQLRIGDGLNTGTYQSNNTFVADGTWRHVAVTVKRASGTPLGQFYIDGVPAGSFTPLGIDLDNSAKLLIGSFRLANSACSCEVSLDEIEIFNTALSPTDIQSIFQADKNGKCKATIAGVKFEDLNGNGVRDAGEPGLANWTIKIIDQNNNTYTVTTDAQGNYSFIVPAPASYTVAEALQSGWTQTAPSSGSYLVNVVANQSVNLVFGNKKSGGKCDLVIRKEVKPNPLISGQPAQVIVTVTNIGNQPCHGPTTVTESLPPVSAGGTNWNCVGAVCTYPQAILGGQTVSVTYNYNVNAAPGTVVENCAGVKNGEDSDTTNNEACVDVKVDEGKLPDLTIKKEVKCQLTPVGMKCKIGFTITNNGPGTFTGYLSLNDLMSPAPSGLGFLTGSTNPPGWNCSINLPAGINCSGTSPVTLAATGSTSFSLEVMVSPGQYNNCVNVKGYGQPPFTAANMVPEGDVNNNESCAKMSPQNQTGFLKLAPSSFSVLTTILVAIITM